MIVLDEPNSNLDEEGEKALLGAILKMKEAGSTIILITHRPSILNAVDNIAVLAQGVLTQYGRKEEVLAKLQQNAQKLQQQKQAPKVATPKPTLSVPKMTKPGE